MIYTRTNSYGIDEKIRQIQTYLNGSLSWNDMHIYGRLYSNQINSKAVGSTTSAGELVPEWLTGNNEYIQVFQNDKVACVVGFIVRERNYAARTASVDVVFSLNMNKLYDTAGREDEKARIEAIRSIKKSMLVNSIDNINDGIDNVYSGFDKAGFEFRNMQPFFHFSLSCTISYTDNFC